MQASNGAITNNVVQMVSLWGVLLVPELYFLESDWGRNLLVAGNTVNNTYGTLL